MNDNYYEEMIQEVNQLVESKKIDLALLKIEQELKMPYIPSDTEIMLNELASDLKGLINHSYSLSQIEVEELLQSNNLQKQLKAIDYLKECNCLNYIEVIQEFFNVNKSLNLQALLIDTLINQQINYEFKINYNDLKIDFNPRYIENSYETEGFIKCNELLNDMLSNDNPSFLKLCIDMLNVESFLLLPMAIDYDESLNYCMSIIRYVAKSLGDDTLYDNIKSVEGNDKIKFVDLLCEIV